MSDAPISAVAALRGYTEKLTETKLASAFPQFRWKSQELADMSILNSALRKIDKATIEKTSSYIRSIMEALETIKSERAIVYRGVGLSNPMLKQKLLGKTNLIFVEQGFGSTTSSLKIAGAFCRRNVAGTEEKAILVINSYSAKNVESISAFPEEAERLLSPGSRFIVWRRRKHPSIPNTWIVSLLELRPDLGAFARVWGEGNILYGALLELLAGADNSP